MIATYVPVGAQNSWVAIVSPSDGETLSGRKAEVSVSYNTGSSEKVTRVEIDVDGTTYGIKYLDEPTDRGITSFLIDTTALPNGSHKLVVKVFSGNDIVGSASDTCKTGNQAADVLPPEVRFAGIYDGEKVAGTTEIEVEAEDASGEDPLVSLFIDKSLKLIKNTPPYTYVWDTTSYDNGPHRLEAYAYDDSGNKGKAEFVDVVVENARAERLPAGPAAEQMKPVAPLPERVTETAATAPEKPVQPPVQVERRTSASAARAVDKPTVTAQINTPPAAASEKPTGVTTHGELGAKEPVMPDQPMVVVPVVPDAVVATAKIQKPSQPVEPQEQLIKETPIERKAAMTAPPTEPAEQDQPMVIAAAPKLQHSLPNLGTPPVEPKVSKPSVVGASSSATAPQTGTPARTIKIKVKNMKAARPQSPQPKPVKMGRAPKPGHSVRQPIVEPRKLAFRVKTKRLRGHVVVGLREAIERAGGTIMSWDSKTRTVLAAVDGKRLRIRLDSRTAYFDGQPLRLAARPQVNSQGRTMVDVHFLKDLLGPQVEVNERLAKRVVRSV